MLKGLNYLLRHGQKQFYLSYAACPDAAGYGRSYLLCLLGQKRRRSLVYYILGQDPANKVIALFFARQHSFFDAPESLQYILIPGQVENTQESRRQEFPLTVYKNVQKLIFVEKEFYPRSAVGYKPRRVKHLPTRCGGLLERDAWRTVKLADYDPFVPVYDESTYLRHERDLAHIDFLFLHFVLKFKPELDPEGSGVS